MCYICPPYWDICVYPIWWKKLQHLFDLNKEHPVPQSNGLHPSMLAPCCWLKFFDITLHYISSKPVRIELQQSSLLVMPPVPLCRIWSRMWTNVKSLKFAPIPVGGSMNQKFFTWTRFFLDNSKIIIRHVRGQLDKVRFLFTNEYESACEVNSNFSSMR